LEIKEKEPRGRRQEARKKIKEKRIKMLMPE